MTQTPDPDDVVTTTPPAALPPKEEVAAGLPATHAAIEAEVQVWSPKFAAQAALERRLVFVFALDAADASEFGRALADSSGMMLVDTTPTRDEDRALSDSAVRESLKLLKGKIGAVVVTHTSLGPVDIGDPGEGFVVNIEPAAPRKKGENEFTATSESRIKEPLWKKRMGNG